MTPSQVLALRPPAASGYRVAWARERLQDTFWPIPALFLAAGAVLAAGTVYAPTLGLKSVLPAGPRVNAGEAASVLGIIAGATLTFVHAQRESLLQQAADQGVGTALTRPDAMGLG